MGQGQGLPLANANLGGAQPYPTAAPSWAGAPTQRPRAQPYPLGLPYGGGTPNPAVPPSLLPKGWPSPGAPTQRPRAQPYPLRPPLKPWAGGSGPPQTGSRPPTPWGPRPPMVRPGSGQRHPLFQPMAPPPPYSNNPFNSINPFSVGEGDIFGGMPLNRPPTPRPPPGTQFQSPASRALRGASASPLGGRVGPRGLFMPSEPPPPYHPNPFNSINPFSVGEGDIFGGMPARRPMANVRPFSVGEGDIFGDRFYSFPHVGGN
jgi:hypothetical protein